MSINVVMLILSLLLLLLLNVAQAQILVNLHGIPYALGPRDKAVDTGIVGGRLQRTKANLVDNLMLFAPVSILGEILPVNHAMVNDGAMLFFAARIVHTICYVGGIGGVRTLAWLAGALGCVLIGLADLGWV